MPLTRINCPECGAGVHSAAGFTAGQVVSCSKCETEFTVDAAALRSAAAGDSPEDFVPGKSRAAGDEPEWSYRTSTLRYVVLGVLLVVMVVLGYMLYDKRIKERQEVAGESEGRGIPAAEIPEKTMPLVGDPVALGGGGGRAEGQGQGRAEGQGQYRGEYQGHGRAEGQDMDCRRGQDDPHRPVGESA